jgi:flavin reductase (DIM6/NTAB) family NADH-FMN oxidoreductase RutF
MGGHEKAFGNIQNGVFVITTKDGEKLNGMTAAWVTRVSFSPPLLAVSIGKTRYSHEMIERSGIFAVNVLSEGQVPEGKHFGFLSGRKTDKLKDIEYTTAETGSPILKDISAYMDCRVTGACDAGDHTIFVGEVIDSEVYEENRPLIYRHEDFF